ncbi:aldehyde-activating protein [Anopheles sinensis]|uniref:Aldehyde-activating protein n=1 Tax=Anopheles sinensis TaxID=74873 RepID=A0A084WLN1_ANOSI|nr:aldehyde-activating protein [Anopheles sinensis]
MKLSGPATGTLAKNQRVRGSFLTFMGVKSRGVRRGAYRRAKIELALRHKDRAARHPTARTISYDDYDDDGCGCRIVSLHV